MIARHRRGCLQLIAKQHKFVDQKFVPATEIKRNSSTICYPIFAHSATRLYLIYYFILHYLYVLPKIILVRCTM